VNVGNIKGWTSSLLGSGYQTPQGIDTQSEYVGRAPIDRGVPLSPSEEDHDFFAASMMSHSKSEPNSIAKHTQATDSPGRRTRGVHQKQEVNRTQPKTNVKDSDWGGADGWDDWDAGEKKTADAKPASTKKKSKPKPKDEDQDEDWDSWGPDSPATSAASPVATLSPTPIAAKASPSLAAKSSPSLAVKASPTTTTTTAETKKKTTLDDDLWNLDDWETLPIDKNKTGNGATSSSATNSTDAASTKSDSVEKLGFEEMTISKPVEKKTTTTSPGLDDLLDFEDVGIKPSAPSDKKENWDWDDDDLEEWLSVDK